MKIPVTHGHLEAALKDPTGTLRGGAVFCHPHPVHGGTMHTKAVYRASQALNEVGLRVLRFNFRGVGCSTGSFDNGIGEAEDVRAALGWLELGLRRGPFVLGGLSFGSFVALGVGVEDPRVTALVALGTPIRVYDYSFLARATKPVLVVQGEWDEFGSAKEVKSVLGGLGDHVVVRTVPGSGHLFEGQYDMLRSVIRDFFLQGPGSRVLEESGLSRGETRP